MKRGLRAVSLGVLATLCLIVPPTPGGAQLRGFELQIESPEPELVVPNRQRSVRVEGRASLLGGIPRIDLFLVLDSSKSLRNSDPENHRSTGAVGLVKSLFWNDVNIGVVDFDRKTRLVSPLTPDRTAVLEAIRSLDQHGRSDLAEGIRTALEGFHDAGRPGSARMMLLFTDGKLEKESVESAMESARQQGVSISTVLFGSNEYGAAAMRRVAEETGGTFVAVRDPEELPDAFMSLRTTGINRVELHAGDREPVLAQLFADGRFAAEVPLVPGENRILARATSFDGRQKELSTAVRVRPPGCAELLVQAERDGRPALSISDRGVEIVVDASGSMWGRMGERTKIEIAKEILNGALEWLPPDLDLSLRAYGHQYDRREQNCEDSELLVAPGSGNRDAIRTAIAELVPRGQTPLGYSLAQIARDFDGFEGERAVVLVTDGIESCGGDPAAEARSLQRDSGTPVHVIGFGLSERADADRSSLRAIADASGGAFVTAGSAAELRRALGTTVGTGFRLLRDGEPVARGTLGSGEPIRVPAGAYRLELESAPPRAFDVELSSEETLRLTLRREGAEVARASELAPAASYVSCAAR